MALTFVRLPKDLRSRIVYVRRRVSCSAAISAATKNKANRAPADEKSRGAAVAQQSTLSKPASKIATAHRSAAAPTFRCQNSGCLLPEPWSRRPDIYISTNIFRAGLQDRCSPAAQAASDHTRINRSDCRPADRHHPACRPDYRAGRWYDRRHRQAQRAFGQLSCLPRDRRFAAVGGGIDFMSNDNRKPIGNKVPEPHDSKPAFHAARAGRPCYGASGHDARRKAERFKKRH